MDVHSYLEKLKSDFSVTVDEHSDYFIIRNGIGKEICLSENLNQLINDDDRITEYTEYTVRFATQHRHFDVIDDALSYVSDLIGDKILPIEFYDGDGCDRLGGEITPEMIDLLTVSGLREYFVLAPSAMKKLFFEIHSFSGKYDTGRKPVTSLPE